MIIVILISHFILFCPICCCSVAQLCPILCNPMNCSLPGFPVLHRLLELAQTHVHWVSDAIQPSRPCHPLLFLHQSFPASGSYLMSWFFISGGQSIGASASTSALPVNIQGWFPLGLTGLISLQSKGLSRVFFSTIFLKHRFVLYCYWNSSTILFFLKSSKISRFLSHLGVLRAWKKPGKSDINHLKLNFFLLNYLSLEKKISLLMFLWNWETWKTELSSSMPRSFLGQSNHETSIYKSLFL